MSKPLAIIDVYKSTKCQNPASPTVPFTALILVQESYIGFGLIILGIILILYGIKDADYIANAVTTDDSIPMKPAGIMIFGGILCTVGLLLCKNDVGGYFTHDVIQRC